MTHQITKLKLSLDSDPDINSENSEELETLTRQIREELLELDVQAIDWMVGGPTPAKAKAGDAITWGTLLLTLAASGGAFTTLISVLQTWLTRYERHSVTLEINGDKLQVTGTTSAEQQQLIDTWLRRHSA